MTTTLSPSSRSSAKFEQAPGALRILLSTGVAISFATQSVAGATSILGVRDVTLDGLALRNPTRLWRPVIVNPNGIHYSNLVLKESRLLPDGGFVLVLDAIGVATRINEEMDEYLGDVFNVALPDEPAVDRLEWEFHPSTTAVAGDSWTGFSYVYRFIPAIPDRAIYRIFDHATWELGGQLEGNTLLFQGQCNPPVTSLTKDGYFTTACNYYGAEMRGVLGIPKRVSFQRLPRIGTIQAFDFLAHKKGALLGLFEPIEEIFTVVQSEQGENWLHIVDEIRRPMGEVFESKPKHILFLASPNENWTALEQRNLWHGVFSEVHGGIRQRYGVEASVVNPHIWIPQVSAESFSILGGDTHPRNRILYELADKAMPLWAQMGVKEVCTHSLWVTDYTVDRLKTKDMVGGMHGALIVGSICNVHEYVIDPMWGGVEALKYFVDKAHAHGIHVQLWWATHLSRRSPVYREHPDYMMIARDGLANGGGFGHQSIITYDLNNPGCFDYVLNSLKKLHEQTGFDGFFHDSYGNMTFLPMNFNDDLRRGQQDAYARLVHELQKAGMKSFTVEGIGAMGVGHFGMNLLPSTPGGKNYQHLLDWWLGYEDMVVGMNLGISQGGWANRDDDARRFSFRCLAGGGRFGFSGFKGGVEFWTGWIEEQNKMLGQFTPLLGKRTLLSDDRGVVWDGPDGQTLFTFAGIDFPIRSGATVTRITGSGPTPVAPSGTTLKAEPWAVYRIK